VAGLAHEVSELGLVLAAGGEQAAAQRVAGEALGVEPGIGGRLLDQPDSSPGRQPARRRILNCKVLPGDVDGHFDQTG